MKVKHCFNCKGKGELHIDNGEGAPQIIKCLVCSGTGHIMEL